MAVQVQESKGLFFLPENPSEGCLLSRLPDELLLHVVRYLALRDRLNWALVCHRANILARSPRAGMLNITLPVMNAPNNSHLVVDTSVLHALGPAVERLKFDVGSLFKRHEKLKNPAVTSENTDPPLAKSSDKPLIEFTGSMAEFLPRCTKLSIAWHIRILYYECGRWAREIAPVVIRLLYGMCDQVRDVSVIGTEMVPDLMVDLLGLIWANCSSLERFDFGGADIPMQDWPNETRRPHPSIKSVRFAQTPHDKKEVERFLSQVPNLEVLELIGAIEPDHMGDYVFQVDASCLAPCKKLRCLTLDAIASREGDEDIDIAGLPVIPELEEFCAIANEIDLGNLAGCPNLRRVEVTSFAEDEFPALTTTRLEELVIKRGPPDGFYMGMVAGRLDFLKQNTETLRKLEVSGTWTGTDTLPLLKSLEYLKLLAAHVPTEHLSLENHPKIKHLTLMHVSGVEFLGAGVAANLTHVHLYMCSDLRDVGFLSQCGRLTELIVSSCRSIANLEPIANFPSLVRAEIRACDQVRSVVVTDCPVLKYFSIYEMRSLIEIKNAHCMKPQQADVCNEREKVVKSISITGCERLSEIDIGLRDFQALERLVLANNAPSGLNIRGDLRKFQSLVSLQLDNVTFGEGNKRWSISKHPDIQEIVISRMPDLRSLGRPSSPIHSVKRVSISNCPLLNNISGLRQCPNLREILPSDLPLINSLAGLDRHPGLRRARVGKLPDK